MIIEWRNYEGIVIADLSDFKPYFWIPVIPLSAFGESCNNYRQVSIPLPGGYSGPVTGQLIKSGNVQTNFPSEKIRFIWIFQKSPN